mmetsp:Transcript_3289/g.6190  ORF Transcript_3289/g.6190 Transcript_3289/m.6190 type:complete len:487 (+) Transcript_3289:63-1523(+)
MTSHTKTEAEEAQQQPANGLLLAPPLPLCVQVCDREPNHGSTVPQFLVEGEEEEQWEQEACKHMTLKQGDWLYLPAGQIHMARGTQQGHSVHVTVGVARAHHSLTSGAMLGKAVERCLPGAGHGHNRHKHMLQRGAGSSSSSSSRAGSSSSAGQLEEQMRDLQQFLLHLSETHTEGHTQLMRAFPCLGFQHGIQLDMSLDADQDLPPSFWQQLRADVFTRAAPALAAAAANFAALNPEVDVEAKMELFKHAVFDLTDADTDVTDANTDVTDADTDGWRAVLQGVLGEARQLLQTIAKHSAVDQASNQRTETHPGGSMWDNHRESGGASTHFHLTPDEALALQAGTLEVRRAPSSRIYLAKGTKGKGQQRQQEGLETNFPGIPFLPFPPGQHYKAGALFALGGYTGAHAQWFAIKDIPGQDDASGISSMPLEQQVEIGQWLLQHGLLQTRAQAQQLYTYVSTASTPGRGKDGVDHLRSAPTSEKQEL